MSFILIGNKSDMLLDAADSKAHSEDNRERAVMEWCSSKEEGFGKIAYFPASAKTGTGVEEAFRSLCRNIINLQQQDSTNLINNSSF